jgi:hypothetical protein
MADRDVEKTIGLHNGPALSDSPVLHDDAYNTLIPDAENKPLRTLTLIETIAAV